MDRKEEKIQKALGTFDYLRCKKCGKVTHNDKIGTIPITRWIHLPGGSIASECIGFKPVCTCGSKEFE